MTACMFKCMIYLLIKVKYFSPNNFFFMYEKCPFRLKILPSNDLLHTASFSKEYTLVRNRLCGSLLHL